ncbi:MAG: hypothetical protein WCF67_08995 [Chitinophagaceae bacterium]
MFKKIMKVTAWCLGVVLLLMGTVYLVAWKSPAYYPAADCTVINIIPFSRYGSIADHPRPMILENKNFVVFGASHTRDPKDPQIEEIAAKWNKLKPTIALVEGRLDFLLPVFMNPVKNLGEGGKVKALANKAGVPVYNWDLSKEELAKQLRASFTAEQIALAQILSPYFGQQRFGRPASPEDYIKEYLSRAKYVNLESKFSTPADVDREWKKVFPQGPDWRTVSDEHSMPGYLDSYLAAINDVRNKRLVCAIQQLIAKGERVFVVCGSSHAACIKPAL